jgi:pseudaminic acid cytidylyltransferase
VNVAVIPARGGSKRIPRKNIRLFAGKPMIAYSIETALRSSLFEEVIVSTDDEEISRIARDYGAAVPFRRPANLADDHTGTTEVVAHAVRWLNGQSRAPAAVCCIYPTAPFLRAEDLRRALALLEGGSWQYVFAATAYAAPIFRSFRRAADGGVEMFFAEHFNTRSQDLPEALHDAGQFYWGRPQAWLSSLRVFDRHSSVIEIPRWRVQDIDTEEDWLRAELLAPSVAARVG